MKRVPVMIVKIHPEDCYSGGTCRRVDIKSKVLYIDDWNALKAGMWLRSDGWDKGWWHGEMFVSEKRMARSEIVSDEILAENGMITFYAVRFKVMLEPEEYFLLI